MKRHVMLTTDPNVHRNFENAIDAVIYLRKKGEHALAVYIVNYRKGKAKLEDFSADLMDVISSNEDILVGA